MGPYPCSQHGRQSGHASMSFRSGWAALELILCFGWKHMKSLPSQHQAIRGTIHLVQSVPFFSITFKKVTVQVNSCPGSSAIQKRRLFCCMWSQHKDNPISCLFLCPYKCGTDPDDLKWLTDLARKDIFYLMGKGKHSILMLFLQRFKN